MVDYCLQHLAEFFNAAAVFRDVLAVADKV
jgi:hypothetical protein